MGRSILLRISAALAVTLVVGVLLVATGSSAIANNGDNVKAGQTTTEMNPTIVKNVVAIPTTSTCSANEGLLPDDGLVGCSTNGSGVKGFSYDGDAGVWGYGPDGVIGTGVEPPGGDAYGVSATAEGSPDSAGVMASGPNGVKAYGDYTGVVAIGAVGVDAYSQTARGIGVSAKSLGEDGTAVWGKATGDNSTGVYGFGTAGNGVFGQSSSAIASGVYGENDGTGFGVAGRANLGTGILADSSNGTALQVNGKASFSRSGVATVGAGLSAVKVAGVGPLTSSTFVLATIQGNVAGIWVRGVVVKTSTAPSFSIYLNAAAPGAVRVAWFVMN